jgi:hypothetical protein
MAIKVKVFSSTSPQVKVKTVSGGGIQATGPVVVAANLGVPGAPTTRFDALDDVTETGTPTVGSVPVYNPANDKYEVKPLEFDDITGEIDIDGGDFN